MASPSTFPHALLLDRRPRHPPQSAPWHVLRVRSGFPRGPVRIPLGFRFQHASAEKHAQELEVWKRCAESGNCSWAVVFAASPARAVVTNAYMDGRVRCGQAISPRWMGGIDAGKRCGGMINEGTSGLWNPGAEPTTETKRKCHEPFVTASVRRMAAAQMPSGSGYGAGPNGVSKAKPTWPGNMLLLCAETWAPSTTVYFLVRWNCSMSFEKHHDVPFQIVCL